MSRRLIVVSRVRVSPPRTEVMLMESASVPLIQQVVGVANPMVRNVDCRKVQIQQAFPVAK